MSRKCVDLVKSYVRLCLVLLTSLPVVGCFGGEMSFSTLSSSGTSGNIRLEIIGSYNVSSAGSLLFSVVGTSSLPVFEVLYVDQSGNTLMARTEGVSLTAYSDSNCKTLINSGDSSFVTAYPTEGKASFSGLKNNRAGTFYIQASALLNTGGKIFSGCSKGLVFTPGPAHHLADQTNAARSNGQAQQTPSDILTAQNGGSAITLRAQVVDQYGNSVVPSSPVSVVFSGFSSGVAGVSGVTGVASTNSNGVASYVVSPSSVMNPWAVYKATASTGVLPGATTPLLFPVQLSGGTAAKILLQEYPTRTFSADPQTLFVVAADSSSIPILDFNSTVQVSNDSGTTLRAVTLSTAGSSYHSIGVTAGPGVVGYFNSDTSPTGQVGSITPAPSVTVASTDCNQGPSGPSNSVAAATGDWSNPSGWLTSGVSGIPTAYNRAIIDSGTSKLLGPTSTTNTVGCVQVLGTLTFQNNTTLQIKRSEFLLSSGGSVSATQGSSGVLQFSRTSSEGVGAQRLVIPDSATLVLDILQVTPAVSGGSSDGYAFFVNGVSGFLRVEDFQVSSNVGNEHYGIYINTQMKINRTLTIPAGAEVIVTPGSTLTLSSGAIIYGVLTVLGGGSVLLGDNKELIVQPSGTLNLRGFGVANSQSNVNRTFAHLRGDSGSFAVAISGGTLNASYFDISDLTRVGSDSGLNIKAGSTIKNLKHGSFFSWNSGFAALTLPASFTLETGFLLDLHFSASSISSSSGSIIDAQAISSAIGVVQSSFIGTSSLSLKSYTTSPSGFVYWDF